MSKKTLMQLVSEMQGKSMTSGWDALTLYDQRKANELLFQLYVERFNTADGYIEPASMVASWGDGSYREHIYDLKLSAPRLSFESSDPSLAARARLTMDMIGGMIVSTKKYSGGAVFVSKMLKVLPIGGPQLWMDQPVTKGTVSGLGDVVIDIKNADTFKANFVFGDLAQDDVGRRFKEYFEKEVKPEQKIFPLGRLEGDLNGALTPKNFEIRTMKSDPLAVFGDKSYGDGAVMMFITLKDGQDSTFFPSANSTYLIPADEGGTQYTGAMLLSSKVLFDKIMRGPAITDIGNGINFENYSGGTDVAFPLKASSGGIFQDYKYQYDVYYGGNKVGIFYFGTPIQHDFKADSGGLPLTIKAGGNRIEFVWNKTYRTMFRREIKYFAIWDKDKDDSGFMEFTCNYSVHFDIKLDKETGLVSFERNEGTSAFNLSIAGAEGLEDVISQFPNMKPGIENFFKPKIIALLSRLTSPTLDTFLLRNLLFPGHNALHLSDAFVPGDLAVFGQIDPLRTTTVLSPMNSTIEAGSKLQFTLTPMPDNVQWSVKDVDGNIALPGVISSTGEYTAPSADEFADGFVAAMVTAEGTLDGEPVKSSALVSVLHSAIVVNPTYDSCDPGDTKVLSAEALGEEELAWDIKTKQWGSTLTPVAGDPTKRMYKAGSSNDPATPFSVDKIEIKKTVNGVITYAYIHILIHNQMIGTPMLMSEASDPSTGTIQFEIRGKNGPVDPSLLVWKLLSGEGTFNDKTGVYTEPTSPAPGSLIIVSATLEGDFQDTHAVAAVPLPLSKYAELIETVNLTLSAG
ncbi:hypothetical protein ACN1C3_33035 [Pseudomonas sp. H11T01]|uniref:hypothetical protein n=1 Tax=Pseudomonas sp. H11T01 TaxID=3402749 RepID=UPI003AD6444B